MLFRSAMVSHLDHVGSIARCHQAEIIASQVQIRNEPVVLTGDFNDAPGSEVHRVLTSPETGLSDTWQLLEHEEDEESFTHHGFTGTAQACRMDWVLISRSFCTVKDACVVKDNEDGWYPSDHFPYMADLVLRKL